MPISPPLQRSVDTLQRIYGVIGALAIGQALTHSIFKGQNNAVLVHRADLEIPLAMACIITVIPFIHGMNMHIDKHAEHLSTGVHGRRLLALLAFDFLVFLAECCLLVVLAAYVGDVVITGTKSPSTHFPKALMGLLGLDVVWTMLARKLEEDTHDWNWWGPNLLAIAGLLILFCLHLDAEAFFWLVALVAGARTLIDYWINLEEYFPIAKPAPISTSDVPSKDAGVS